jgi:hypothetical protein
MELKVAMLREDSCHFGIRRRHINRNSTFPASNEGLKQVNKAGIHLVLTKNQPKLVFCVVI